MTSQHLAVTASRSYARMVRTTLRIDDDVLEAARCIADEAGISVGQAMSRLARRGLAPRAESRGGGRFPTFAVPCDASPIRERVPEPRNLAAER